jgi:hypothetical protein
MHLRAFEELALCVTLEKVVDRREVVMLAVLLLGRVV